MYLFDTDVLTNVLKPNPSQRLFARLKDLPRKDQFTTTITIGEIVYGAFKSKRPEFHLERLETLLLPRVTVLPFAHKAAYEYGKLRAALETRGMPLAQADLQIAAIAIAHDLTLVSGNSRHFSRVDSLKLENWL